ncbi:MAG: hypothetical protein HXX19_09155, partial [Rhodoferax sp.]|nr:hypothetical protein [Rhodoferax sp.]
MQHTWRPVRTLLWIAFAGLLTCLAAVWFAVQQPWLGLVLAADEEPGLRVVQSSPQGPGRPLAQARRLLQLSAPDGSAPLDLQAIDKTGDPDELLDYAQVAQFTARQSQMMALLRQPVVQLTWLDAMGQEHRTQVSPAQRPLTDLPFLFWFEMACALGGLLISAWVFALRAEDRSARFFALTGLCMFVAILVQSLYQNRELAIAAMARLDALNHFSVFAFGCALVNLFLCYPHRRVPTRYLVLPWALTLPWWLLDAWQLWPDQNWGVNMPLVLYLLVATVLAVQRWRQSRQQPLERAALRWFLLSFLLACWLFVFTT